MHPALIICIFLAIVAIGVSIAIGVHEDAETGWFIFFIFGVILVGLVGFGLICSAPHWTTTYQKLPVDKVEMSVFEQNGIVAITYNNELYQYTDISVLNAVKNLDYYVLKTDFNAYGIDVEKKVYPVEKGKINDYIKEK